VNRAGLLALAATIGLGLAAACSTAPEDSRIGVTMPSEKDFPAVEAYLTRRCGTIDCHGNAQRNLVIWGCAGLRLAPPDADIRVGCDRSKGGAETTADETAATYRSVVGLEPTAMANVVAYKGQHPELLSLVRKARNTESHKGGGLVTPGDLGDQCITSWLAGATNQDACRKALPMNPFSIEDAGAD
jgi:hypothetical protein